MTINEIANAAAYRGDAALGGYIPSAIEIDTKPVETLAAYTVMQNKSFYDQRQKDADAMVQELARLSQYNIANARGKDKEMAIELFANLQSRMREYAMSGVPKNAADKVRREADFKSAISETITKIDALNARGIAYNKLKDDINAASTTPEQKKWALGQLDKNFDNTSWDTPLSALPVYNIDLPKPVEPQYTKTDVNYAIGNQNYKTTLEFFNQRQVLAASQASELGLLDEPPPNATQEQRDAWEFQKALAGSTGTVRDMAKNLNDALNSFKNKDGSIDESALMASGNTIAINNYKLLKSWNEYAKNGQSALNSNQYVTRDGKQILNIKSVVPEGTFIQFDLNKPITGAQILAAQSLANAKPDTKAETFTFTGEELKQQELALASRAESRLAASAGGGGNKGGAIEDPANAYMGIIQQRAQYSAANPNQRYYTVPYNQLDDITKEATGVKEGAIRFDLKNGGFDIVTMTPTGIKVRKGGSEQDMQKRINEYYKSNKRDESGNLIGAENAEGFQKSVEQGYINRFGTTNPSKAYKNTFDIILNGGTVQETQSGTKTVSIGGKQVQIKLPN